MYGKQARDFLLQAPTKSTYINRTYRIEEKLGSGGNCKVYKAWHNRLRKFVALKIAENCSTEAIAWHRNEVEALKNIKSTYLPYALDFLVCDNQSFTILEYVEGVSFDKLLRYGHIFTEAQVLKWYRQLACALQVIHAHDVCHRDIKPANIVLTANEDICLIDFNSARVISNNTGMASSSTGYASPEQHDYFMRCKSGNYVATSQQLCSHYDETMLLVSDCVGPDVDWKLSDIYSLGATIFHLLIGERPPTREKDIAHIPKLKGFCKDLLVIIERSMRFVPSQRFVSATELYDALSGVPEVGCWNS